MFTVNLIFKLIIVFVEGYVSVFSVLCSLILCNYKVFWIVVVRNYCLRFAILDYKFLIKW